MKRKNPWIAALLNILFLGLGYLYNGKRKIFGWLLLASEILSGIAYSDITYEQMKFLLEDKISLTFFIISYLLFVVATAYDAYDEAKKMMV